MVIVIAIMLTEFRLLMQLKQSYFHRFQSYMELGVIVCSWTSVGIYIWRYKESKRIGSLFRQTNGYTYVNLQLAAYVNDILTYLLGFCCFFGTIKFLHLCRFNQRLLLFNRTLRNAGKELLSFAMMFSVVFFAFLCLFYFLFNSTLWSCSNLLHTAEMLFEMTLMKFDAHQLLDAAGFLGPFCFSLFILLVVFVCMSMFLSIINESFRQARDNVNRSDDEEIFSFMLDKFLRWTGNRMKVNKMTRVDGCFRFEKANTRRDLSRTR